MLTAFTSMRNQRGKLCVYEMSGWLETWGMIYKPWQEQEGKEEKWRHRKSWIKRKGSSKK